MVGDEDDSKCLAKNGLVLSRGTGRARTSRPSASRQVVAEEIAEKRFVVRTHCTAAGYNSTADRACGM